MVDGRAFRTPLNEGRDRESRRHQPSAARDDVSDVHTVAQRKAGTVNPGDTFAANTPDALVSRHEALNEGPGP